MFVLYVIVFCTVGDHDRHDDVCELVLYVIVLCILGDHDRHDVVCGG